MVLFDRSHAVSYYSAAVTVSLSFRDITTVNYQLTLPPMTLKSSSDATVKVVAQMVISFVGDTVYAMFSRHWRWCVLFEMTLYCKVSF